MEGRQHRRTGRRQLASLRCGGPLPDAEQPGCPAADGRGQGNRRVHEDGVLERISNTLQDTGLGGKRHSQYHNRRLRTCLSVLEATHPQRGGPPLFLVAGATSIELIGENPSARLIGGFDQRFSTSIQLFA